MTEQTSSRDRGVGVTLKGATGYDAPWITFSGSVEEVRQDIIAAFGFNALGEDGKPVSNAEDLDLHDLTVEAAKAFSAQYSVAASLGGKPVGRGRGGRKSETPPAATSGGSEGDGWDDTPSSSEPEAPAGPNLEQLIADCASVADLRNLWADHTEALQGDADLLAKWKARGRELSAA